MLEHVHHRVPVTALAFYNENVILAGEGSVLCAYGVEDERLLARLTVFDGHTIHGLLIDPHESTRVTAYGGRFVRSIKIDVTTNRTVRLDLGGLFDAEDWILDAAYSPAREEQESPHLAFITAHNALAVACTASLGPKGEDGRATKLQKISQCGDCILYCAHISWLSDSHCLIASGTAFGDIIVWSCFLSSGADGLGISTQQHYTFSAHEGSVFGVRISEQLTFGQLGQCRRALSTCSDDRTVRLWDISDLTTHNPPLEDVGRETGFGSKVDDANNSPTCLARVMGHVSRIWHVRFITDITGSGTNDDGLKEDPLRLMSFGEDASNIIWNVLKTEEGSGINRPYTFQQLYIESAHSGKHIWSVAQSPLGHTATGGADGGIGVRPASRRLSPSTEIGHTGLGFLGANESVKAYGFVSHSALICTTSIGRIVRLDFDGNGNQSAHELSSALSGLKSYSLVSAIPDYAFIAGSEGSVYLYDHDTKSVSTFIQTTAKVTGLFALRIGNANNVDRIALLVTSIGTNIAQLAYVPIAKDTVAIAISGFIRCQMDVEDLVVTSFAYLPTNDRQYAIIGTRNGSLYVYDVSNHREYLIRSSECYLQAHGREAITAVKPLRYIAGHYYIHSTGRDGTHAVFRFDQTQHLECVHQLLLPFGPNIEGLSLDPDNNLRVWGFRHKQFVVYDVTRSRDIMTVDCGGAHRSWVYDPEINGGTFIWTKASKIYRHTQKQLQYQLIGTGGHGREIKTSGVSTVFGTQIVATGAEDTNIKLYTLSSGGDDGLQCVQTLRRHTTGIQYLQLSFDGLLFSSGGFEELFVWSITPNITGVGLGVICESTYPRSGTSDLRIMNFLATPMQDNQWGARSGPKDAVWIIDMLYSDSTMKRWKYEARTWVLMSEGDYLTACLTNVLALSTSKALITAATDGHLASWTPQRDAPLIWSKRHQVHQNAILSMTVESLSDGSSLVITGGDDNAIGISRYHGSSHDASTLLLPRSHAAAVTGLMSFINASRPSEVILFSTSIDQRLKMWVVEVDISRPGIEGIDVKLVRNVHTAVADVSSLSLCSLVDGGKGVLICGVGMDIWRLPTADLT